MARSRRANLVALSLGIAVALLLAELVLRTLRPEALDVVRYPCIYQPDPRLGFRYTPGARGRVAAHFEIDNSVEINSLGFYDAEPLPRGEASPRILAVGDSFTAAMNVPRDAVWTAVLEDELRGHGHSSADVVNLGLDGTGTDVHLELLREYIPRLSPDIVLVAFYANDFLDVLNGRFHRECYRGFVLSYKTEAQRSDLRAEVDAHRARPLALWLFRHFHLVRLAHLWDGRSDPFHIEFLQPTLRELDITEASRDARRPRVAETFRGLEALARSCECRVLLVPVPPRSEPSGSARLLGRLTERTEHEMVDPLPAMKRILEAAGHAHADLYFSHDAHFNTYGNAVFGRAVAEVLLALP